jgi:hypothetical protein
MKEKQQYKAKNWFNRSIESYRLQLAGALQ